ncbi:MAG TPA: hypothetical protein VL475_06345, partial [Planctomycetaceae bacterium]|nr:hypothetical protein [Planctomycetaceae bacterium]
MAIFIDVDESEPGIAAGGAENGYAIGQWGRKTRFIHRSSSTGVQSAMKVNHSQAVISGQRSKRLLIEDISFQPLQRLSKIQKLHFFPVLFHGVVDQLDDLFGLDPAVRVEDEIEYALLEDGDIERRFQIADRVRVVRFLQVLSRPVTGDDAGEFPAEPVNDIGIRIVFDVVHEVAVRASPPVHPRLWQI